MFIDVKLVVSPTVVQSVGSFEASEASEVTEEMTWRANQLAQHYYQTQHAILIPADSCQVELKRTDSGTELLVYPPSRTYMLTYPFHVLEHEFANLELESASFVTIWINKYSSSCWKLLTYRVVDDFPEFKDHIIADSNLGDAFQMFPPTEEVLQRYAFLNIQNTVEQLSL